MFVAIIEPSEMPEGYDTDKAYLVIRVKPLGNNGDSTFTPKKTFDELPSAVEYAQKLAKKHDDVLITGDYEDGHVSSREHIHQGMLSLIA